MDRVIAEACDERIETRPMTRALAFAGHETLQPAVIAHGDRRPESSDAHTAAHQPRVRLPSRHRDPHTETRTDFSLNNQVLACWALARSLVIFSSPAPTEWYALSLHDALPIWVIAEACDERIETRPMTRALAFAGHETLQPAVIAHGDRRPEGTIPPAEADHLVVRRPIRKRVVARVPDVKSAAALHIAPEPRAHRFRP